MPQSPLFLLGHKALSKLLTLAIASFGPESLMESKLKQNAMFIITAVY